MYKIVDISLGGTLVVLEKNSTFFSVFLIDKDYPACLLK